MSVRCFVYSTAAQQPDLERNYSISEMLSVNVKLWDIVNQGDFNEDISDFMGYGVLTTRLNLNNWLELELLTFKGTEPAPSATSLT